MSIWRRPTRAAGYSWRQWEDPIMYAPPTEARIRHLLSWALLGTCAAFIGIMLGYDAQRDALTVLVATAALGGLTLAWASIMFTWNEMQTPDYIPRFGSWTPK